MKKQTAFRLSGDLLQALADRAKSENRSLNNYVETVLKKHINELERKN